MNVRSSAIASEHHSTTYVEDWTPPMKRDVQDHQTCDFLEMLNAFLIMALPESQQENPPDDLLDMCLRVVLPMCNGQISQRLHLAGTIRKHLVDYCKMTQEVARYVPFTKAMNAALDELQDVKTPLNSASEVGSRFILQRHDLKPIHGRDGSMHKPDVLGTEEGTAFESKGEVVCRVEVKTAHENPPAGYRLSWSSGSLPVELKGKRKPLSLPPRNYKLSSGFEQVPHQVFIHRTATDDTEDSQEPDTLPDDNLPPIAMLFLNADSSSVPTDIGIQASLSGTNTDPPANSQSKKTDKQWGQALVQASAYASERLLAVPGSSHAISLIIHDNVAWVWWYDREGAIQSGGVDFIKDLPYFLVLLLAFQRFTKQEWGRPSVFHSDTLDLSQEVTVTIPWDRNRLFKQHFGLAGRGTCVVTVQSTSADPRNSATTLKTQPLIVKIYWPEAARTSEIEVLGQVQEAAKACTKIAGHVPDLIAFRDFAEVNTKRIRTAFRISPPSLGWRYLRVLAFPMLIPITELTGLLFWRAFLECFVCHYHLWMSGVRHRDISPSNLMFYPIGNNLAVGVLNDFDFSTLAKTEGASALQRTGTLPFLALDLLHDSAMEGQVPHRYRHDAESFLWSLAWICIQYRRNEDGSTKQVVNEKLKSWHMGDVNACRSNKRDFLYIQSSVSASSVSATLAHKDSFEHYTSTLGFQRTLLESGLETSFEEPSDADIFNTYMLCFGEEVGTQSCTCKMPAD